MSACLSAILRLTRDEVPPSYDEIARALGGLSKGGVNRLLTQMRERGYVDWLPGHARSLRVVHEGHDLALFTTAELNALQARIQETLTRRSAA